MHDDFCEDTLENIMLILHSKLFNIIGCGITSLDIYIYDKSIYHWGKYYSF